MNRIVFLLIAILFSTAFLNAQEVVLEREVDSVMVRPNFGPNQNFFIHGYAQWMGNWTTNSVQELDVVPFLSGKYSLGVRAKKKITRHTALISDLAFSYNNNRLTKAEADIITYPKKTKEMARSFDIDLGAYARIGFGQRGDYIGKFIDIGYYLSQPLSRSYVVFAENESGHKMRRISSNTDYIVGNWNHGPRVHIGLNRYVFVFQYRLSDFYFGKAFPITHIPRLSAGVQIGFH